MSFENLKKNVDFFVKAETAELKQAKNKSFEEIALDAADHKLLVEKGMHRLRTTHAWCLFALILFWILMLWLMLGFVGYKKIELAPSVIIAAITSTTASVLGLYGIAAYWMFGKKAISADENTQEM